MNCCRNIEPFTRLELYYRLLLRIFCEYFPLHQGHGSILLLQQPPGFLTSRIYVPFHSSRRRVGHAILASIVLCRKPITS